MPTAQVIVRQANGQSLVLSENDRIIKEVTINCESPRCASRHGQDNSVSFTFNDQDPFPEAGDQFMSLILPERSPSNEQYPRPFCSPTCLRDYLMYSYLAPSPRTPADNVSVGLGLVGNDAVDNTETVPSPVNLGPAEAIDPELTSIAQADGDPGDTHGA